MKLVVGLGNPGKEYEKTKHNVGFRVVDDMAQRLGFPAFTSQAKHQAAISRQAETILVKPQTYMNASGESVRSLVNFYRDQQPELWVIHDDLDLELGNYKIQLGTGPKIHNGLLSIYHQLGTKNFWHVRVGVDTRQGDRVIPSEKYVLLPFTQAEEQMLTKVIAQVSTEVITRLKKSP